MDEPRTHYQLSFTARQALLLFVALLGALAAAYAFGLMTGLSGHGRADAVAAAETTPVASAIGIPVAAAVTPDTLEIPKAVRGIAPSRTTLHGGGPSSAAPTPVSVAAGPAPSPGIQLFDEGPDRARPTAVAPPRKTRTPRSTPETAVVATYAPASGSFWVQALSAPSEKEAKTRRDRLASHGFPAAVSSGAGPNGKVYRVRVGPFKTKEEAERSAARLKTREKLQPWIVPPGK
ncbi:MAG: SPOR domain-containing protein [Acidobacteriota bacterium]